MPDSPVVSLGPTLADLTRWFSATRTPYVVIGGAAVSLLARPRTTKDVDAVAIVDSEELLQFVESGAAFNFRPRIPNVVEFATQSRVLLLAHQPDGTGLDISIAGMAFEIEAIENAVTVRPAGIELRLPRVEDLIVMKAIASRPADLADIQNLLEIRPNIDRRRVRRLVAEFAELMDRVDIIAPIDRLLAPKTRKSRGARKPRD